MILQKRCHVEQSKLNQIVQNVTKSFEMTDFGTLTLTQLMSDLKDFKVDLKPEIQSVVTLTQLLLW